MLKKSDVQHSNSYAPETAYKQEHFEHQQTDNHPNPSISMMTGSSQRGVYNQYPGIHQILPDVHTMCQNQQSEAHKRLPNAQLGDLWYTNRIKPETSDRYGYNQHIQNIERNPGLQDHQEESSILL